MLLCLSQTTLFYFALFFFANSFHPNVMDCYPDPLITQIGEAVAECSPACMHFHNEAMFGKTRIANTTPYSASYGGASIERDDGL